jgi:hypothetical protein
MTKAVTERQVTLKELSPKHKQVLSLIAQGVGRQEIAQICDITPEYVSWIAADPLAKEYMNGLNAFVDAQLESMYGKAVQVIDDAMTVGDMDARLKGARLHLEVTKRIGREGRQNAVGDSNERLVQLAEKLTGLLASKRGDSATVIEGESVELKGENDV